KNSLMYSLRLSIFLTFIVVVVPNKCPFESTCECVSSTITCNGNYGQIPIISLNFSLFDEYIFENYDLLPSHAFDHINFPSNQNILIQLINVFKIENSVFSSNLIIPINSTLTVDISHPNPNNSNIIIQENAFNNIILEKLRFHKIKMFNGRREFDTKCFGQNLQINEIIFQQSNLEGFTSTSNVYYSLQTTNILSLIIEDCPLPNLKSTNLPIL
ncbi:unnamed protein product, partial [Didymodactylos carnosus]